MYSQLVKAVTKRGTRETKFNLKGSFYAKFTSAAIKRLPDVLTNDAQYCGGFLLFLCSKIASVQ